MTETMTGQKENDIWHAPSYDRFGDDDEALAWVLQRLSETYKAEGVRVWWTSPQPQLDGHSAEVVWHTDPDRVIQTVAGIEK